MLSPATRSVLEHVATAGSTFDTDDFLALSGLSEQEAFDCLDAALAAPTRSEVAASMPRLS